MGGAFERRMNTSTVSSRILAQMSRLMNSERRMITIKKIGFCRSRCHGGVNVPQLGAAGNPASSVAHVMQERCQ